MIFIEKTCAFMFKSHLPFSVYADSGQRIQSSTPRPSKCVFFRISLELCAFFMSLSGFSRSRNSFSRSPTFNKHVRFTLFASSGSHRHTSLQNPLPKAMAVNFHCIHFLSIIISPSHPCHSQLPPRRIPFRGRGHNFPLPPPQRRPPAAAGPRRRARFPLQGAAT